MVSNCCGAKLDESEQICSYCKEGCEAIEDYEYQAIEKENYLEMNNEKE